MAGKENLTHHHELVGRHFEQVVGVYERLLPVLATGLNEFHNVNHSQSFWDVLLAPYFISFLSIVRGFGESYDLERPTNSRPVSISAIDDLKDLHHRCVCGHLDPVLSTTSTDRISVTDAVERHKQPSSLRKTFHHFIFQLNHKILIHDHYLTTEVSRAWRREWNCNLLARVPLLSPKPRPLDLGAREQLALSLEAAAHDPFEQRVVNHIKWAFPRCYLEDFASYDEWGKKHSRRFRLALFNTGLYYNVSFQFTAAWIRERGGLLLLRPHGGIYGQVRHFDTEYIERRIADRYITGGWEDDELGTKESCLPICDPQISALAASGRLSGSRVVWISNAFYSSVRWLWPVVLPQQAAANFAFREDVFRELGDTVRETLYYRPYQTTYRWETEEQRFRRHFDDDHVLTGGLLTAHMRESSLILIDHLGTSLHESLALNVPTVCFWDASMYEIRNAAEPYFKKLRSCRILHHSPAEAADHINVISRNPEDWWRTPKVQEGRKQFLHRFARVSSNYVTDWRNLAARFKHGDMRS